METELLEIVTPETAGDPMGQRKWVRSRRNLRQRRRTWGSGERTDHTRR